MWCIHIRMCNKLYAPEKRAKKRQTMPIGYALPMRMAFEFIDRRFLLCFTSNSENFICVCARVLLQIVYFLVFIIHHVFDFVRMWFRCDFQMPSLASNRDTSNRDRMQTARKKLNELVTIKLKLIITQSVIDNNWNGNVPRNSIINFSISYWLFWAMSILFYRFSYFSVRFKWFIRLKIHLDFFFF